MCGTTPAVSVSYGDDCPHVLLGEGKQSLRAAAPLSPGSPSGDMTLGASAGLVPHANPQWGPISHCTQGHPGPPAVATPLAQAFGLVTTGAASGRLFSAREVPASSGCWVEHHVFTGTSPQLAWRCHFSQGGMGLW